MSTLAEQMLKSNPLYKDMDFGYNNTGNTNTMQLFGAQNSVPSSTAPDMFAAYNTPNMQVANNQTFTPQTQYTTGSNSLNDLFGQQQMNDGIPNVDPNLDLNLDPNAMSNAQMWGAGIGTLQTLGGLWQGYEGIQAAKESNSIRRDALDFDKQQQTDKRSAANNQYT